MTHTVKVHLTSFEEQNSFLRDVSRFKADINLYEGSQCFDAKSLIAVFSLLDEVSLLLEETALSELEETVFSELELSGFVVSELELVGLVVSLLEEVSLLLEETVFSELELVVSELELAGFVVSLLEEVSLLLEETVSSELDDFAELELSGSVCSELELTELELSGSSSELELWLLEDSLSTSTDA